MVEKKKSGHAKSRRRTVGYINLALAKDPEQGGWVLAVERIDPYGGQPFRQDYWFQEYRSARDWFGRINGNEDIFALHRETDLDDIENMPGTTYV